MLKKILLLIAIFIVSHSNILADDNLKSELVAHYSFVQNQSSKVVLDFKLINASPTTFVTHYQISVPEAGVSNLVLLPKNQKINQEQSTVDRQNVFNLTFENEVVGQGKSREFALEYHDSNLLKVRGNSKTIKIPSLHNAQDFSKYQSIISLPTHFGKPDSIKPQPLKVDQQAGVMVYTFDQTQGQEIEFIYGTEQFLQFSFSYLLTNNQNSPAYQEIILPKDTDNLKIIYANLWPLPHNWQIDEENNWLGYYLLKTGENITVVADGYLIYNQVDKEFDINNYFSKVAADFQSWNIETIPQEYLEASIEGKIKLNSYLDKFSFLPLPGRYRLSIQNQSGQSWYNLSWHAISDKPEIIINQSQGEFTLLPWQTIDLIIQTRNQQWWQLYQSSKIKFTLTNQEGKIIDEYIQDGLCLSYFTIIIIGSLVASSVTAGSILVARFKSKNSLCRESQKSKK